MDQIEFADGFDTPDTLAFGLGAGQLAVVMSGALAAYSLVRSPLPPAVVDPLAVLLAGAAAALGWVRVAGRPALDWAVFAGRFWLRPRRGAMRWTVATVAAGTGGPLFSGDAAPDGSPPWFDDLAATLPQPFAAHASPHAQTPSPSPARGPDPSPAHPPSGPLAPEQSRSPVTESLASAVTGSLVAPASGPPTRIGGARRITFFSLRGGTGRSTLATELTCLLAASRASDDTAPKVALVDLDLRSPSVAVRVGATEQTLLDFALAPPDERSVVDFMVTHASGARLLLGPQRAVNPEWPVTPALLREVLRELDMEGFDLVVLDVSPELSLLNTTAICACDDVFVVVVPTAGGVQDAYRSTEALRRLGLRHQLRYIVNRSRPETDLSEPMADLGGQLIGDIPDDESVITAENEHRLVGVEDLAPAAIALRRLARRVSSELRATWPS
jgi:MinD-like ATPase involved in chromosome partitioning or flagellar assembly